MIHYALLQAEKAQEEMQKSLIKTREDYEKTIEELQFEYETKIQDLEAENKQNLIQWQNDTDNEKVD